MSTETNATSTTVESTNNSTTIKAIINNVRSSNKDVLEFDEASNKWLPVYKADGTKAQYQRLELVLSKEIPCIEAGTFNDSTTTSLVVSTATIANVAAAEDFDVACLQADAEDKGFNKLPNSVVMRLVHKATVELEITTRNVGDEYITNDGEVKTVDHKHYRIAIKTIALADGAVDKASAQLSKL